MNSPISAAMDDFQALPNRRSVLGCMGMAGLGWLATSAPAAAVTAKSAPQVNVQTQSAAAPAPHPSSGLDLPPEWAMAQGAAVNNYWRYLNGLRLKNINPAQVVQAHAKQKGEIWNTLPPQEWWVRMGYILRVADRIAAEMNVRQVEVVSAYRCPAYNAHCEGAKARSWHQANIAVDIKMPVGASTVTAYARNLRDRGLWKGGIGGYDNFTHIDARGVNVNW